jgi:hypothetical protein
MADDHDTRYDDPWAGAEDPQTIASIGAELERIAGGHAVPEVDPFDGHMLLPLGSIDEVLRMLREIPSNIGMAEFAARLRDRFGNLASLKAVDPEHQSEDGA